MQVIVSLTVEISTSASIDEMEEQIQEAGQQAMWQAIKESIRQWEQAHPRCEHGQADGRRLEGTSRRVIATRFGRVAVPRRRFRCLSCGRRSCPATRLFAGLAGATVTPSLQEVTILAGCSWPSRTAAHVLRKLSGAQISAEEIRRLTNRQGMQRAQHQQAEAERVCAEPPAKSAAPSAPQPMLVGLDGGWVCSREQRGGMEGKVAVVCSQMEDIPMPVEEEETVFSWARRTQARKPRKQRHRLTTRTYVATFAPSRHFGALAKAAALALDEDPSRPGVVLADGAPWIKKEQRTHFSQGTCILDWAHLWRDVRAAIRAAARGKALDARARDYQRSLQRSRLWLGSIDLALHGLRELARDLPADSLATGSAHGPGGKNPVPQTGHVP